MELTEAIVSAVEKKLRTLEELLSTVGAPHELRVDAGKSTRHHNKGEVFKATADLKIPGRVIRAEATSEDLYSAIDEVRDKLRNEILKATKSRIDEKRSGAREAKERGTETELV